MPPQTAAHDDRLHVAIIGAGITGVSLGLGLQARGVAFTMYERADGIREIGAGIGFSPNAERAMAALGPDVRPAYKRVANPNGEDYFQWVDGHGGHGSGDGAVAAEQQPPVLFRLYLGKDGFQGCRRRDVLDEWAGLLPPAAVRFNKELDAIISDGSGDDPAGGHPALEGGERPRAGRRPGKLTLRFKDGSTAHADAVIGCDGIHSRVRQLLFSSSRSGGLPGSGSAESSGPGKPSRTTTTTTTNSSSSSSSGDPSPGYTHKFCFRALVPMQRAVAALGEDRARTRFMYVGPGAHALTYPVGHGAELNVLVVASDVSSAPASSWPSGEGRHTTARGSRAEARAAFTGWRLEAVLHRIVDLLPETMDKWAIFDMFERPAPRYARGRVCVAGDAAHAAGPHLGAGAGMGIEDALVLAELMAEVQRKKRLKAGSGSGGSDDVQGLVEAALAAYSEVRYERTQEVVRSTRAACDLFHWQDPEISGDPEKFGRDITARFHRIWDYDVERMVQEALSLLNRISSARQRGRL